MNVNGNRNRLVVFGNGKMSSLAWYCLTHDSPYSVVAFTVDRAYLGTGGHEGLPTVAFEEVERVYPPSDVSMLVPIGFYAINGLRRARYETALGKGYTMARYVCSNAKLWPDLHVPENCIIYEGVIISPFCKLGENVVLRSNAYISHHCVIGSHAFIAAGVTLGGSVTVGDQAFIGLGAVVREGVSIAERSFIGAGAVVLADTEPDAVYLGNPARKIRGTASEVSR